MSSEEENVVRRPPLAPEMNVTPLVDVVLVLLIIFMVVTPQMESGANLELPVMSNPDKTELEKQSSEPTILSLTKEGTLYFNKLPIEADKLDEALVSFHAQKPEERILLKADREAAYGKVRALFKKCQTIGFPGISLQVIDRANQSGEGAGNGV
jgi:biopolymer transport protein TolR